MEVLAVGHNARYGTTLCALSAIPLLVHGTLMHSGWCFAVLSSLIHRVFTLSLCRRTYRFVPDRIRENGSN